MASQRLRCYPAVSNSLVSEEVRAGIIAGIRLAKYNPIVTIGKKIVATNSMNETLAGDIARSDCIVAEISHRDPIVFFELGLAQAMGKGIFLLMDEQLYDDNSAEIFLEFHGTTYSRGETGISKLTKEISEYLTEFRRFPQRRITFRGQSSTPFFVDWEKLSFADSENLCKELLTQMGFKRLDWEMKTPEIDLIAEFPRKDPDGFEYRELWLVSMGFRISSEPFIDMMLHDPDYFLHRIFRYSDDYKSKPIAQNDSPITLLMLAPRNFESNKLDSYNDHLRKRSKRGMFGGNIRLRVWDQNYLTSLIHQFPQIGYKYFSDEGRLRSETRKSYEDLYHENSSMNARQRALIVELEDERAKRVSAERDAVWKDISFAAAHKIGNPIFAVETDLDPLIKRIRENRKDEAIEVVGNIRSAVEKAKGFVEQFKSLAKAQQIELEPVLLRDVLDQASRTVCNQDIKCQIDCPVDMTVMADSERLVECFDELIANSIHWFDKSDKEISINVLISQAEMLPSTLDSAKTYALIHFLDNGPGVSLENKNKIFDAFFTTYDHGTGLGLALVRRIIDGHGGTISEIGLPGAGADFEIFLPLATNPEK